MMKNVICIALTVASFFALTSTSWSRDVSDEAKFFSPEAVRKANEAINRIKEKNHKDVVVETYPRIPENKKSEYSPARKDEFYIAWMRERAQALKVDGIYILITRDPSHLQVGVGAQTSRMGFTREDRDKVRNILVERFKRKEYDSGLLDSITFVSNRFDELGRARPAAAPARGASSPTTGSRSSSPGGLSWMTWLIIGIVGLLIVRFIMRSFQRMAYSGPQPPAGPGGTYGGGGGYGPPPAGGGGFFTSMLGGLFGGAAGNWLANRWTGGSSETQNRPPEHLGDEGRSFEGSGGDFGNNEPPSGGGDFGSPADQGGGDFGGGESGGGSDGGGDF
jgi:uncharacterized membrane protein YeaQ/YmgE (transglycosylase-associated protein family)